MTRIPLLPALALSAAALHAQGRPAVPFPAGNPPDERVELLGKALFWEEQLSSAGTVACATCHMPEAGGSDPRSAAATPPRHPGPDGVPFTADDRIGSAGVIARGADGRFLGGAFGARPQVTPRKAPSVVNAAYAPALFWDGRAAGPLRDPLGGDPVLHDNAPLENQALGPPTNTAEMAFHGRDWADVAARIAAVRPLALATGIPPVLDGWIGGRSYPELFRAAFGSAAVTPARIAMALAAYQRTLVSWQSRYDDHVAGDPQALTAAEVRGMNLFFGAAGCDQCHPAPEFTDHRFHNIGVRPPSEDPGRRLVTGLHADRGRFRTPTLRNVARRAPYFHNGLSPSLADVVDFYNRGGNFRENLDPAITALGLTLGERSDLVAFLGALTDPRLAAAQPPFDHPRLFGGSGRAAVRYGSGSAGGAGIPAIVAVDPPRRGNDRFTLGLEGAAPGALPYLVLDLAPGRTALSGITCHLGLTPSAMVRSLPAVGSGGLSSVVVGLPGDPAWAGVDVYAQWFLLDPAGVGGAAASDAAHFTLF